eukprot:2217409-Pleurochrysis_carterae.AAC.2
MRTLRQTVSSSNAAMGTRGSHHTARSGTRHHRPWSHPAIAGSPVPSRAASPRIVHVRDACGRGTWPKAE